MKNVASKMWILFALAIVSVVGFFVWKEVNKSTEEKQEDQAERQKRIFRRHITGWADKIFKGKKGKPGGFDDWYVESEAERAAVTRDDATQAAYYQIKINQPEVIPSGYGIEKVNGRWKLVEV